MSRKRSFVVALAACGLAAFLVVPWTTAQEKSVGQAKKGATAVAEAAPSKANANSQQAKKIEAATEKSLGKKGETNAKSNKVDKSSTANGSTLRLPRYFSGIVDQEQRDALYAIQLEYRLKIAELEEELARLRQDELSALEKVLTDSQRKLLAKKRSQAQDSANAKAAEAESADNAME